MRTLLTTLLLTGLAFGAMGCDDLDDVLDDLDLDIVVYGDDGYRGGGYGGGYYYEEEVIETEVIVEETWTPGGGYYDEVYYEDDSWWLW